MNNSDAIILYVDYLMDNGLWGYTEDISKINKNIDALGANFTQDFEIKEVTVSHDVAAINFVGKYLCMIYKEKDEGFGYMTIFDFTVKSKEETEHFINTAIKPEFIDKAIEIYRDPSLRSKSASFLVFLSDE